MQGQSQNAKCCTGHRNRFGDASTAAPGVLDSVEINSRWYHESNRRSGYCQHFHVQNSIVSGGCQQIEFAEDGITSSL